MPVNEICLLLYLPLTAWIMQCGIYSRPLASNSHFSNYDVTQFKKKSLYLQQQSEYNLINHTILFLVRENEIAYSVCTTTDSGL